MQTVILPTYFPSISHYVALLKSSAVVFEMHDHFQKQTNRNRMYIYSPNGIQLLNVPVKRSNEAHQYTQDVRIENDFGWQKQHFKSLEAAYRSSPFFEYFEDDILPVFQKKHTFLMDLNLEVFALVNDCLGLKIETFHTENYEPILTQAHDLRVLAQGKKDNNSFDSYTQVFGNKHGFLNNLSILDLLFNEGRYALDYLKNQTLTDSPLPSTSI